MARKKNELPFDDMDSHDYSDEGRTDLSDISSVSELILPGSHELDVLEPSVYIKKANVLITAKYKLPLFPAQLITMAMSKLHKYGYQMQAILSSSEIKQLLDDNDPNIYRRLKAASKQLMGNTIVIEDGKSFLMYDLVTNTEWHGGEFKITFNEKLTQYLDVEQLRKNYTRLELASMLSFDRPYTMRLYELLSKETWRLNKTSDKFVVREYEICELRAMLGLIDVSNKKVKAMVDKKMSWVEIFEEAPDEAKQFSDFRDFKRRVLEPARKEFRAKADIFFEYKQQTYGSGRKTKGITFMIFRNEYSDATEKIDEKTQVIDKVRPEYKQMELELAYEDEAVVFDEINEYLEKTGMVDVRLTLASFRSIYKAAKKNIAVIKEEIDYSTTVPEIHNYGAWLHEAVKHRYSMNEPVATLHGSAEKAQKADAALEAAHSMGEDAKEGIWQKMTSRGQFPAFLAALEDTFGFDLDYLNKTFSAQEKIEMYTTFVRTKIILLPGEEESE